jgi:transposase
MDDVNDDAKAGFRRVEVLTGPGRRRRWLAAEKERIVEETLAPGARVSAVARRWQVCPQQVFGWRRAACRDRTGSAAGGLVAAVASFVPISSSMVMKTTPVAVPGRCSTSTRPATATRCPSRLVNNSAQVMIARGFRSPAQERNRMLTQRQPNARIIFHHAASGRHRHQRNGLFDDLRLRRPSLIRCDEQRQHLVPEPRDRPKGHTPAAADPDPGRRPLRPSVPGPPETRRRGAIPLPRSHRAARR